ncbi:MAG: hypothetical protein M1819_002082 [Sarea resinae]|nr:MAG: hypothetical protein M1819_002082 [Sarea resinae]
MGSLSVPKLPKLPQLLKEQYPKITEQQYLLGLRGVFVIEAFLWVFLQVFAPAAVKDANNHRGPHYQVMFRKTLSVLFWNETLIYSAIILISARTICISFLRDSNKTNLASALFRRGLRLWFPAAVALAIVMLIFSQTGTSYIGHFQDHTHNSSFNSPYLIPNALAYFNSVFNIFWTVHKYNEQAASTAFPSQTLWILSVIYQQSYTIYISMIIIPFTRNSWRVKAWILYIITAWWVQSWAWYSITGLALADMVMNMGFKEKARRGIPIWRSIRCPVWIPYSIIMAAGLIMQYLWVAWRPQYENRELRIHTGEYYTGGLNNQYDINQPQARDDNYLVLVGLFLFLETYDVLQWILSNRFFLYLGTRSLSYFFMQGIIIYTAGIKLFMHLNVEKHLSHPASNVVTLIVCLITTVVGAEVFHRLIDYPSQLLAHKFFDWIQE